MSTLNAVKDFAVRNANQALNVAKKVDPRIAGGVAVVAVAVTALTAGVVGGIGYYKLHTAATKVMNNNKQSEMGRIKASTIAFKSFFPESKKAKEARLEQDITSLRDNVKTALADNNEGLVISLKQQIQGLEAELRALRGDKSVPVADLKKSNLN